MSTILFFSIAGVAVLSALLGENGYTKTERYLDGTCIAVALVWIALTGGQHPCVDDLDPLAPWERPATRHAIDWRAR